MSDLTDEQSFRVLLAPLTYVHVGDAAGGGMAGGIDCGGRKCEVIVKPALSLEAGV